MIATSARLLRLLSLLQSRHHWPALHLSERLEIDVRTVRRDVDKLRQLGYPIHASSGAGGGYSMRAGAAMPPVLLNDDEAVAVAVALRAAAGSIGRMDDAAIGVLAKIDQVMPARLRKRASSLHAVTVSLPGTGPIPPVNMLLVLAGACRDSVLLEIDYKDRENRSSVRCIEPMRLAHTGMRWYLVAWDRERDAWRTFRADRIARAQPPRNSPTGHFIPRKLPKDVVQFVAESISIRPFNYRIRLRLQGSVSELAAVVPSWTGVLEAHDEQSCILNTGATTLEALAAMILCCGRDFEVLDAPAFLPRLREVAGRLGRGLATPATFHPPKRGR